MEDHLICAWKHQFKNVQKNIRSLAQKIQSMVIWYGLIFRISLISNTLLEPENGPLEKGDSYWKSSFSCSYLWFQGSNILFLGNCPPLCWISKQIGPKKSRRKWYIFINWQKTSCRTPFSKMKVPPRNWWFMHAHPFMKCSAFFQVLAGILKWAPNQSRHKTRGQVSTRGFLPSFMVDCLMLQMSMMKLE